MVMGEIPVHASKPVRSAISIRVIHLMVTMYVLFPLSLRNVENLLFERGIDICRKIVPVLVDRFGPWCASDIRRQRVDLM